MNESITVAFHTEDSERWPVVPFNARVVEAKFTPDSEVVLGPTAETYTDASQFPLVGAFARIQITATSGLVAERTLIGNDPAFQHDAPGGDLPSFFYFAAAGVPIEIPLFATVLDHGDTSLALSLVADCGSAAAGGLHPPIFVPGGLYELTFEAV